jgi:hypothetical protein
VNSYDLEFSLRADRIPLSQVGECIAAIRARECPEFKENHLAAKITQMKWWGIEPLASGNLWRLMTDPA